MDIIFVQGHWYRDSFAILLIVLGYSAFLSNYSYAELKIRRSLRESMVLILDGNSLNDAHA